MMPMRENFLQPLWHNGPVPGGLYQFPGMNTLPEGIKSEADFGVQRSSQPITTGTSVIGVRFDDGVMMAADNLISYGSLARFQNIERVFAVNNVTIMGAGGDYADFQCIKRYIDQKVVEDVCHNDNIELKPKSLYNWLTRILYNRRSRFDPFWIDMIVGGMEDGEPFLGHIDLRGRSYQDQVIATGFGKHLALPLLREHVEHKESLTQLEASQLIRKCMEVLFYRDCRASPQYSVAVCTKKGSIVQGPINVNQNWEFAKLIQGY